MANLRLSFVLLISLGFLCAVNCNPLSFFGKSSDDKAETEEKVDAATPSTAKTVGEATTTTTTTPGPSSSCGGLKGFLHICDKNEPTEPPKTVKTRSVGEEDDSDESDESDSDSDESSEKEEKKATETSPVVSDPTTGAIVKRQVGDPEAPVLGEIPPVLENLSPPVEPEENSGMPAKRQAEDTDEDDDTTEEIDEESRKRRDCRDEGDENGKNCRKKRELVPTCFAYGCAPKKTTGSEGQ